jgi:S1-C subfamily serine protease
VFSCRNRHRRDVVGRPTAAQPDIQIARAPEALSASFAEIARRVEPAVVNIETTQNRRGVSEKDEDKEISRPTIRLLDMFRRQRRPTTRCWQWLHRQSQGYILTNTT